MTQILAELCTLLVEDVYGGLPAAVYKTLSQCSRVTEITLAQRSSLSRKHVRHALVVLIQQHLILYSNDGDDSPTVYEVDWAGAYDLVRYGRMVSMVEGRYGRASARIMQDILFHGHIRVSDLEANFDYGGKTGWVTEDSPDGANGAQDRPLPIRNDHEEVHDRNGLHDALEGLLKTGFVTRVNKERTFRPAADRHNDAQTLVQETYFPNMRTSGGKAKVEFDHRTMETKRKWRTEDDGTPDDIYERPPSAGRPTKRVRINADATNGRNGQTHGTTPILKGDIVVKANLEKCCVAMRSKQLEALACRFSHPVTARVYGVLLRLFERGMHRCRDDWVGDRLETPTVTTLEVRELLDEIEPDLPLSACIHEDAADTKYTNGGGGDDPNESHGVGQRDRLQLIDQHLRMLAEHPKQFLIRSGTRGISEWKIDFAALTKTMQAAQVETVISARFGYMATRIVSLLQDKRGRLDEKIISNLALLPRKDIRNTLAPMQEAGLIDTQEIPRDTSRQPQRATYLWFFDQERVVRMLLADTYKAMARLVQRTAHQRSLHRAVLDKADREDVRRDPRNLLTDGDHRNLAVWREQEEKLLTQLMRQDDLVALFRDF